ncbi:nuclear transport factor 2 family protein [Lusitaniella coriacea LEGE 07157]|uniref:Nuclear transport factor 2 family protein n=2 Tax=Lusitaniella TaxID=1983104 RepID=A0A8J7E0W5_9CYAN|nr:nuclear transport factor 2 family protein [Lusitaniella coriacea LEGE 07157]
MTDKNDRAQILAANEAFYRAFEQKDLKAMSLLWSQGTGSICIHPGRKALCGWQQIRTTWEKIFRSTESIEIDTEIINVEIGQQIAYILLLESVLQVSRGRKFKAQSMATNIFAKMAQKWYLVHHHGSPIMK